MLNSSGLAGSSGRRLIWRSKRSVLLVCGLIASGLLMTSGADEKSSRNEYARRSGAHARFLRGNEVRALEVRLASPRLARPSWPGRFIASSTASIVA